MARTRRAKEAPPDERPPSARPTSEPRCGARVAEKENRPAGFCTNIAGFQTDHVGFGQCRMHGGITPAGKKAAARQAGRDLVTRMKFGGDRTDLKIAHVTAEEALLEEVRRSVAMVRWLEERIGVWEVPDGWQDDTRGGLPNLGNVIYDDDGKPTITQTEKAAWLTVYREERAHAAKVAKMAIDAGIAERMVTIAEDQGAILVQVIKQVLDALNLNPRQARMVPEVVPGVIRALTSGQPGGGTVPA